MKTQDTGVSESRQRHPAQPTPHPMRRIKQQRHPKPPRQPLQLPHPAAHPKQVHPQNRLRPALQRRLHPLRIHLPRPWLQIAKHRLTPRPPQRMNHPNKRERRHRHPPSPQPKRLQHQHQRQRPVRHQLTMRHVQIACHLPLQLPLQPPPIRHLPTLPSRPQSLGKRRQIRQTRPRHPNRLLKRWQLTLRHHSPQTLAANPEHTKALLLACKKMPPQCPLLC